MAKSPGYDDGLVGAGADVSTRPRRKWKRIGLSFLGGLLAFAVGLAATVGVLLWRGERGLDRTNINMPSGVDNPGTTETPTDEADDDEPTAADQPEPEPTIEGLDEVLNVLAVGSDTREGLGEENADLTGGDFEGIRTDTIMLVRVDPRVPEVSAISLPRDLRIPLCGHAPDKVAHAYFVGESTGVGGPACLVETVSEFSGVEIDHFVQVDFAGFIDFVDELGGVSIYLEEPMQDPKAHLDVGAGCKVLDGREALGFVRTRADSDFGRIARQQRFLHELIEEVTSAGTLLNIPALFGLVDTAAAAVTVDDGMSMSIMRRLAVSLRGIDSEDLVTATVPTTTDSSTGVWYEDPIEAEAEALFRSFRRGGLEPGDAYTSEDPPSEAPTDRATPELTAADVPPLRVLNAAGVGGLAGATADALRAGGFTVASVGDAERRDRTTTVIRYPAGHRPAAEFLARAFEGAALEGGSEAEAIEIELGRDVQPDQLEVPTLPPAPEAQPEEPAAETEETFANAEPPENVDC